MQILAVQNFAYGITAVFGRQISLYVSRTFHSPTAVLCRLAVWWVPCGLWTAEATDSLCHPGGEVHVNSRSSWQKPGREVAFKNEGLQCALKSHSSSANCHFDSPGLHWLVTARKLTLSTSVKLLLIYQPSADAAGAPSAHLGPRCLH